MRYQTVVFDLDGTLLNTLDDLTASVNAALSSASMPLRTKEEVRQFVGNGIGLLMKRAVPANTSEQEYDRVFDAFCTHYQVHCNDRTTAYPGILSMLSALQQCGVHLAIVSNKADFAVKELANLYFSDTVSVAIGEKSGVRKKPAPDTVFRALEELGMPASSAVYVGDSDVDIETAKNAGIPCISVTYGFRDRAFLLQHGASVLVDDADSLFMAITGQPMIKE